MTKKVLLCLVVCLASAISLFAQNAPMQPLTFWYEYSVNPGKEAQFMELVKTVGQPVRDKLLAEGVVLAWGVATPLLRVPGRTNHMIWYAVADWAGIEKVDQAMAAQIAKLDAEGEKPATGKKGSGPSGSVTARLREVVDMSKTHDYVTRDIVFGIGANMPKDVLPFTRFNFVKVKPGKGSEYRKAWEKYNKPILDKLLADGTILVYGLGVEEVRTEGDFTHYTWFDTKDLAGMDKVRAAFIADREHRSQEEQDAISALFASLVDTDASRQSIERALILHVSGPK
jgi:hypothetical protein